MPKKSFPADIGRLDDVIAFVEQELETLDCPAKDVASIDISLEEIFVNVAHYAYPSGVGEAEITLEPTAERNGVSISISDKGQEFNPLEKPDPDITLSAEERKIGGLGIYMTKKMMNSVVYERRDNTNILTMVKYFS